MKTIFITLLAWVMCASEAAFAADPVNEKVLETFHQMFGNAENVQWNTNTRNCNASFSQGDIRLRVFFDKNGSWQKTIRYYKNDLPSHIRYTVIKKYEGKEIYGVTETTDENGISYEIVIQDTKNLYRVVLDDNGRIRQKRQFKRADL